VPSEKRPALVDRFRDDPNCRVFLSTDAGSTGLNLQHASTLVNMDLPWNPAILEQRIGRIHRMGQKRPVQIVNFIAKGTIEEGMLSVLAFKRSLSAGILDGGTGEISLGGSRLNRFMKDIENVTGSMGQGETVTAAEEMAQAGAEPAPDQSHDAAPGSSSVKIDTEEQAVAGTIDPAPDAAEPTTPAVDDPWGTLLQFGAQFAAAFGAAEQEKIPHSWIERDPRTGMQHLKVPLPPPETARKLANILLLVAESLQRKGN